MSNDFAAIMFADVSGSSRLFKQVGDTEARAIVSRVVSMMMDKTREHNGVVIKTIGDECMSSFPTAEDAVKAAIDMQNDINNTDYGAPLTIRIGFHYGAVINEDGDVYGEAVNDAADLVKVAKGGQIITSNRTREELTAASQDRCSRFDEIRIKGGKAKEVIYIVQWEEDEAESNATMFMAAINTSAIDKVTDADVEATLILSYNDEDLVLKKEDMPFSLGRGLNADLTVMFKMASREHCTIDYRRGKFVLIDNSTNGTHVTPDGRQSLYLRREETPLIATGTISFSPNHSEPGPHRIRYSC